MQTEDLTISPRSRNLGYAWTNTPVQKYTDSGHSYLGFNTPRHPQVVGGPRTIRQEMASAARGNSGNDWHSAFFVGGRRVVAVDGYVPHRIAWEVMESLDSEYAPFRTVTVTVER